MANVDGSKVFDLVTVDPNFSLPAGVADLGYTNPDDKGTSLERSEETGEVVSVSYDEVVGSLEGDLSGNADTGTNATTNLLPPDVVTVVSQVTRQTSDGRYVVDVVIEIEDMPGVTNYEVGITKA